MATLWPRNYGHIREMTFGEREKYITLIIVVAKIFMAILGRVASVESGQ